jgi:sugar/nucleoside kinase (ribokinase family)
MNQQKHIAFIGDLTIDKYVQSGEIRLGGAALNGAIWARKLGAKSSVVTTVGTDNPGREMIKKLKKEHISKTHLQIKHGNTSSIEINLNEKGERSYGVWDPGTLANYHLRPKDINYLIDMDAIVVTVYPQFAYILSELSLVKKNIPNPPLVVINFGDLKEFHQDLSVIEEVLPFADFCVFGLDKDADEGLINSLKAMARSGSAKMLITLASHGSLVYDGTTSYVQSAKQVSVVDTTGAGDSFLSAFVMSYLKSSATQESLLVGTELASDVIGRLGAY